MKEPDCTRHAIRAITGSHGALVEIHTWDGEFRHVRGGQPDKLVLAKRGWLGSFLFGQYHLHAVESKVDPGYFSGMNRSTYPDALHQVLDYPANSQWLSIARDTLDGDQWNTLEEHCQKKGVGLISCTSRDYRVLCSPREVEGTFWREYPSLHEEMKARGFDV